MGMKGKVALSAVVGIVVIGGVSACAGVDEDGSSGGSGKRSSALSGRETGTKKSDKGSDKAAALGARIDDDRDGTDRVGPHAPAQVSERPHQRLVPAPGGQFAAFLGVQGEGHAVGVRHDLTPLVLGEQHVLGEFVGDPPVVGVAHGILGHELRPAVGHAEDALPHLGTLGKTRHLQLHAITVGRGPSHRKACFPDRDGPSVRVEPRRCLGRVAAGRQLLAGAAREDLLHRGLLGGRDP